MDEKGWGQARGTEELILRLSRVKRKSGWEIGLAISVFATMGAMIASAIAGGRNVDVNVSAPAPLFFGALLLLLLLAWLLHDRTRRSYMAQFESLLHDVRAAEHEDASIRDSLTGLFNRAALEEFCDRALKHCQRVGNSLVLAVFDLDHFRAVNNRFGHIAGDLVLTQFARVLQDATRGSDFVARFGGDEFVVLLPETDVAGCDVVIRRINERLEARNASLTEGEVPISFTSGVAESRNGADFVALFNRADSDLLERKRQRSPAAVTTA